MRMVVDARHGVNAFDSAAHHVAALGHLRVGVEHRDDDGAKCDALCEALSFEGRDPVFNSTLGHFASSRPLTAESIAHTEARS